MGRIKNLRKILDAPAQTMVVKTDRACPAGPVEEGFIQLECGTPPIPRFTLRTQSGCSLMISLFLSVLAQLGRRE